jgi:alkylhydroperoxidase/carboxymuconolactone decarboxylase family protein YurZ
MALTEAFRALGHVFVAACTASTEATRDALRDARAAGVPPADVDEALLLVIAYAGVPAAVLAFGVWRELEPIVATEAVPDDRRAAGERTFAEVYGPRTERIKEELRGLHPVLLDSIIEDSYGRILARTRLSARDRELLAIPMLVALGAGRQTAAHALGARAAGASEEDVLEAVELADGFISAEEVAATQARLAEFLNQERGR